MATPTAAYSVHLRVRLQNTPGSLGRLAAAVGAVGGNIVAIRGFEAKAAILEEDVIVDCVDVAHIDVVRDAVDGLDGVEVLSATDRTFEMHQGGKIEVISRMPLRDRDDLSMAYTPGVARVCVAIADEPALVHDLTIKKNTVAIVTDGTAVLGLGDIGPAASLPVMEGKALLFKNFAGVDAFPVCIDTSALATPQEKADAIVETVERIATVFGGVNLEDIAAPACFAIEERLRASLDIPVFHDDQHGTAVVTLAALTNALRIVDKKMPDLKVVISGAGAAGVAIAKILMAAGVTEIIACDSKGILSRDRTDLNDVKVVFAQLTNPRQVTGTLSHALVGADVFIGVSAPDVLTVDDIKSMAAEAIVFAMANPDPEIRPELAVEVAAIVATGRSDFPNQINNVLAFPGIFRGALDAGATTITEGMKVAAAHAIASAVSDEELSAEWIVPSVFQPEVVLLVAEAVAAAAIADGVTRRQVLMAAPPEAVTFDFWNTLVRDDSTANRSRRIDGWLGVLEGEGFSVDGAVVAEAFQANWDIFQTHWEQNLKYRAEDTVAYVLGRLGLDPEPSVRDALVDIITEPAVGHEPALNPNIESCLATLKAAGVRIGIICDVGITPSRTLRHYLDGHGVLQYFDHWSFSDEVGVFKPDPVIFRHAMAGLGVTDPATMAHIGDLRRTDVAGANALGITSVRYAGIFDDPGHPDDGPEFQATYEITDHADLPQVLGLA